MDIFKVSKFNVLAEGTHPIHSVKSPLFTREGVGGELQTFRQQEK